MQAENCSVCRDFGELYYVFRDVLVGFSEKFTYIVVIIFFINKVFKRQRRNIMALGYTGEKTQTGNSTKRIVCKHCGNVFYVSDYLIDISGGRYECPYCRREQ